MSRPLLRVLAVAAGMGLMALAGCAGSTGDDDPPRDQVAPTAAASPAGGLFTTAQSVALTAADNQDPAPAIYYTTDGTVPSAASTLYADAISVPRGTTIVKFLAVDTSGNTSAVVTETYTVDPFGGGAVAGTSATPSDDLTEIAGRLTKILALGYNTVNPDVVAKQLLGKDAKPATGLFVLDTRDAADFNKGHIPGAANIPLPNLPQALLDDPAVIPADKDVVVASYYGGDGNMASLLVNAARIADPAAQLAAQTAVPPQPLPYKTSKALFMGMMSWSFEKDLTPSRFDADLGVHRVDKAFEKTANANADQGKFPALTAFTPETDTVGEKILVRARTYFGTFENQRDLQTDAVELAALLDDGVQANDPQVVSVRGAADYALGHVPGAVNVQPYAKIADLANLTKFVSTDKPVVVYCYTGHTGALSTMTLGILGYNVRNLLYGMNGWSQSSAANAVQLRNFDLLKAWDLPLNNWDGMTPTLAAYDPPSTGCKGCHTSLTALMTELWEKPTAAGEAPPSVGEG